MVSAVERVPVGAKIGVGVSFPGRVRSEVEAAGPGSLVLRVTVVVILLSSPPRESVMDLWVVSERSVPVEKVLVKGLVVTRPPGKVVAGEGSDETETMCVFGMVASPPGLSRLASDDFSELLVVSWLLAIVVTWPVPSPEEGAVVTRLLGNVKTGGPAVMNTCDELEDTFVRSDSQCSEVVVTGRGRGFVEGLPEILSSTVGDDNSGLRRVMMVVGSGIDGSGGPHIPLAPQVQPSGQQPARQHALSGHYKPKSGTRYVSLLGPQICSSHPSPGGQQFSPCSRTRQLPVHKQDPSGHVDLTGELDTDANWRARGNSHRAAWILIVEKVEQMQTSKTEGEALRKEYIKQELSTYEISEED